MAQIEPRAIAGAGILGIGLLLHIIGLATPNWELGLGKYNVGLWGGCLQSLCTPYPEKTAEIAVCEAFAIIGCLLGAGSLGLALIHSFMILTGKPKNVLLPFLSALGSALAFVAATCVGVVWSGRRHDPFVQLTPDATTGYSFYLSVIGGALMGVGSFFMYVEYRIEFLTLS